MAGNIETAQTVEDITGQTYKYGFVTDIETETAPKGLNEEVIGFISDKKSEPGWLLDWRLKAYRHWLKMPEPEWARVTFPPFDYQDAYYYSAPKSAEAPKSLDEVDPEVLRTYEKPRPAPSWRSCSRCGLPASSAARCSAPSCGSWRRARSRRSRSWWTDSRSPRPRSRGRRRR